MHGAVVNITTNFIKTILLATFLTAGEVSLGIYIKDIMTVLVAIIDIVGLFVAINSSKTLGDLAREHKFQAVGLGWAFGDSLVKRLVPIAMGATAPEYTLEFVQMALQSNIVLINSISFACVGALLWGRRSKSPSSVSMLRTTVLLHAMAPALVSVLEHHKLLTGFPALVAELCAALAGVGAAVTLYSATQSKSGQAKLE